MCLYVTRFRRSICENRPKAVPRYSPVGSKAPVNPKSSMADRYTPPFWILPPPLVPVLGVPPPPPVLLLPPHAAATSVSTAATATIPSAFLRLSMFPPTRGSVALRKQTCGPGYSSSFLYRSGSRVSIRNRSTRRLRVEGVPQSITH